MLEIDPSEKILRIVRRHWFVLLGDIVVLLVCVFLPVILVIVTKTLPLETLVRLEGSTGAAISFFIFAWVFIVWMIGWNIWTTYYLDTLIITNRRIFNINQERLFHRASGSFRIDRIQNIIVGQEGIIETLLNFGTLTIETAGEKENFTMNFIARPYDVKKFINEMQDVAVERSQEVHWSESAAEKMNISHISGGKQLHGRRQGL